MHIVAIIRAMKKILPYLIVPAAIGAAIVLSLMTDTKHPYIHLYDKQLKEQKIPCLSLSVFPPDSALSGALEEEYPFRADCPWRLTVKTKENIHCNSNQNSDKKALSAFPNSFLRMEIHRGFSLKYSYYVDLTKPADSDDALEGFDRIRKYLK